MALNEQEIKQKLGIESFRNLSKDNVLRFAAMMPDIDTEVALKIIEQFPDFKEFALDAVDNVEKAHESTLASNDQSQNNVYTSLREIREILKGELGREDLSWEQRKFIIEQIQENARSVVQNDSENKKFLHSLFNTVGVVAVGTVMLGVAFVGGRIMLDQGKGTDNLDA